MIQRNKCFVAFTMAAVLLLCGRSLPGQEKPAAPQRTAIHFGAETKGPGWSTERFLHGPGIVADSKDGALRLAHSVLVADEIGATVFHQTEDVTDRTWAKKVLLLDSADVTSAELFLYGGATEIRSNGEALTGIEPLVSTGWSRARVPQAYLK